MLENKFYTKLGKVDGRIPILQLTRSRRKKQKNEIGIEKHGFKPGSRRQQVYRLENNRDILECL